MHNCFLNKELDESKNQVFWQSVQINREGSCIILQKNSEAVLSIFGALLTQLTPYFATCEQRANLGCETARPLASVIDSYQELTYEV
jgi:hypothetical protein